MWTLRGGLMRYQNRADAALAAALRALRQPASWIDEYDDTTGEYLGSIVVTASYRHDETAPPHASSLRPPQGLKG